MADDWNAKIERMDAQLRLRRAHPATKQKKPANPVAPYIADFKAGTSESKFQEIEKRVALTNPQIAPHLADLVQLHVR